MSHPVSGPMAVGPASAPAYAPEGVPAKVRAPDDSFFRALVECADEIVTVVESDGRIAYDSPAVERVLGYRQGELVGRNAFEFVHADDVSMAFGLLVETVSQPDGAASLVVRFQHRDGSWRWLSCAGRLLASPASPRLVITSRDVTAQVDANVLQAPTTAEGAERAMAPGGEVARALEAVHLEMLQRLALAAEFRDDDTGLHTRRVGELSARLAQALGLSRLEVELIRNAAPLHDVGKIGVPDAVLLKPGPLSSEELELMRTHTVLGARILASGRSTLVRAAEIIAMHHHERWDGEGYPSGLKRDAIPLAARIVSIVDFFDALSHDRPYRPALPLPEVLAATEGAIGTRFDPHIGSTFLRMLPRSGTPQPSRLA
jgi:PAS domain S-box-containing protein/putative nucleotidyltransferase with HDIG domain